MPSKFQSTQAPPRKKKKQALSHVMGDIEPILILALFKMYK